jgi:hypothetical protein
MREAGRGAGTGVEKAGRVVEAGTAMGEGAILAGVEAVVAAEKPKAEAAVR